LLEASLAWAGKDYSAVVEPSSPEKWSALLYAGTEIEQGLSMWLRALNIRAHLEMGNVHGAYKTCRTEVDVPSHGRIEPENAIPTLRFLYIEELDVIAAERFGHIEKALEVSEQIQEFRTYFMVDVSWHRAYRKHKARLERLRKKVAERSSNPSSKPSEPSEKP